MLENGRQVGYIDQVHSMVFSCVQLSGLVLWDFRWDRYALCPAVSYATPGSCPTSHVRVESGRSSSHVFFTCPSSILPTRSPFPFRQIPPQKAWTARFEGLQPCTDSLAIQASRGR